MSTKFADGQLLSKVLKLVVQRKRQIADVTKQSLPQKVKYRRDKEAAKRGMNERKKNRHFHVTPPDLSSVWHVCKFNLFCLKICQRDLYLYFETQKVDICLCNKNF